MEAACTEDMFDEPTLRGLQLLLDQMQFQVRFRRDDSKTCFECAYKTRLLQIAGHVDARKQHNAEVLA